jgi:hypothetical protein
MVADKAISSVWVGLKIDKGIVATVEAQWEIKTIMWSTVDALKAVWSL